MAATRWRARPRWQPWKRWKARAGRSEPPRLGAYLLEQLQHIESPLIREVRGLGLMVGIELKQKVAPYLQALAEQGVLALPAGLTVIRLLPPLVITRTQLDQVLAALAQVLAE